ncbi:putative mitochondrion protein [Lentinula lateritia]|uniref:Mitochondrion protein n=1 Tax=Lentinula lateritia TaxID=40482 RepID=A0ABQ8VYZ9_9AGAR|nr:putative mitochondrion protein [Lentinula lateritia]
MSIAQNFVKHGKKILAIGRNYDAHIKELGNPPNAEPWFFLKPTTSYLRNGGTVLIPEGVQMHHEIELGVVIGKDGKDIKREDWEQYVAGYALGIDMTARNFQQLVKAKSLPWTSAKGFDTFCPISDFIPKENIKDPMNLVLWIKINGEERQRGNTAEMIYDIPELIRHCSSALGLIVHGDKISAGLERLEGEVLATWDGNAADRVGGYVFNQNAYVAGQARAL